jgi:hypothetical protein
MPSWNGAVDPVGCRPLIARVRVRQTVDPSRLDSCRLSRESRLRPASPVSGVPRTPIRLAPGISLGGAFDERLPEDFQATPRLNATTHGSGEA